MSFFDELKRRNVFKVGIAYGITSWLLIQVTDILLESIGAPPWVLQTLFVVLGVGFVIALFFAWAFELTPEGVKREADVDRGHSITPKTGRKLDFAIIGVLLLAVGYFIWESRFSDQGSQGSEKGSESFSQQPARQTENTGEKMTPTPSAQAQHSTDNSIAVLPFANRSKSEDDAFFTDGIHDDLLTQLAQISNLKVSSRTSVMQYKNTHKTIPQIAAELGVSTILEGGIQRAGKRIRINAQLIDVITDKHLWAETFDREMTVENIFDIQSEITRQIVQAVRGELSAAEVEVLAQLPTHSLAAYEAYLQARSLFNLPDYTQQKFEDAEPWLEKAVALDPEFAQAWNLLAVTHSQAIWQGYDDSKERLQRVREALSKATEYGPFLPDTLAARADYLYRIENNYHAAEVAFRAASKAKPGDAELMKQVAYTQRRTGKWEQSVSNFQLAFELDPVNVNARTELIGTLMLMGEYDRAEPLINSWIEKYPQAMDIKSYKLWLMVQRDGDLTAARNLFNQIEPNGGGPYYQAATFLPFLERDYQAAIDIYDNPQFMVFNDQPNNKALELQNKGFAYGYMGNSRQADEFAHLAIKAGLKIQSASAGTDAQNAGVLSFLAFVYAQTGELAKALQTANQACALIPESRDSLAGTGYSQTRALILAMSGEREAALLEITRLLSVPGGMNRWTLYLDPAWDFFRDDERFNELIRPEGAE